MMIFILIFWYYSSSFCAVFKNTQIPLIKDTFIGYVTSFFITLFFALFFWLLRVLFLNLEFMCCECLYKAIDFIDNIIEKLSDAFN